MKNFYLERFAIRSPIITDDVNVDTSLIIVIPCYNETQLLIALQSLKNCTPCIGSVEVIVVINAAENSDDSIYFQNQKTLEESIVWIEKNKRERLNFFLIQENKLPRKHAGVGLARKIGMDEAVRRFEKINNPSGVIVCFDADCTCSKNYFIEIEKAFLENKNATAASIKFEHKINLPIYKSNLTNGIVLYELHLRYYIECQRYAKFPYAFHTIGSSMAVRSIVYQKQGGMNKRKAGEDFYFLQKIIPLGNFLEINNAIVFPSSRTSDRVPFGTGKAMLDYLAQKDSAYYTYNFQSFKMLKVIIENIPNFYETDWNEKKCEYFFGSTVNSFLQSVFFKEKIIEIKSNTSNFKSFENRFFDWFNSFMILKFVHFIRDQLYKNINLIDAVNLLYNEIEFVKRPYNTSPLELLVWMRGIQ
jgi:Glycosyl transferase family 2